MITFRQYMENALYGPSGYYNSGVARSGRSGDYFTAPDVSPVFGRLLAALFAEWSEQFAVRPFHWVEMGAGEGGLAKTIGEAIVKDHSALAPHLVYTAVERSSARRYALGQVAAEMPCAYKVLPDLLALYETPLTGCFFSNELIDAFPVHRVRFKGGRLEEAYVDSEESSPRWVWAPPSTEAIAAYFDRLRIRLPDDYETEVNLAMAPWLRELSLAISSGLVVIIDYGRPAPDYYAPERQGGTLRGFRDHEVRRDVLVPGIFDMTADVDFTSLALDAKAAGFEPLAFMEMGSFLMMGAKFLANDRGPWSAVRDPNSDEALRNTEHSSQTTEWSGLRYLVHPEGMGSAFQVLVLGKGLDPDDWQFEGNRIRRLALDENGK